MVLGMGAGHDPLRLTVTPMYVALTVEIFYSQSIWLILHNIELYLYLDFFFFFNCFLILDLSVYYTRVSTRYLGLNYAAQV